MKPIPSSSAAERSAMRALLEMASQPGFDFLPSLPEPGILSPEPILAPFFDPGLLARQQVQIDASGRSGRGKDSLGVAALPGIEGRILELAFQFAAGQEGLEDHAGDVELLASLSSKEDLELAGRCLRPIGEQLLTRWLLPSAGAEMAGLAMTGSGLELREALLDQLLDGSTLADYLLPDFAMLVSSFSSKLRRRFRAGHAGDNEMIIISTLPKSGREADRRLRHWAVSYTGRNALTRSAAWGSKALLLPQILTVPARDIRAGLAASRPSTAAVIHFDQAPEAYGLEQADIRPHLDMLQDLPSPAGEWLAQPLNEIGGYSPLQAIALGHSAMVTDLCAAIRGAPNRRAE